MTRTAACATAAGACPAATATRASATIRPRPGLDYYGARYYDPVIGQFASADTMLAGGLNRYAYVGGNPETKVDPTGHDGLFSAIVSVVQAAAPVALQVVGTVTGVTSMISDVQTIANTIQHGGDPLTTALAVGDLALNVAMDVSMVTGVGEVAMGLHAAAEIGAHVAADAAEHAAADTVEHAAADEAEHAAEDGASDAMKGAEESCPLSFAASTLVATTAGVKPIASLKTGDHVTAYDPKAKGTSTQTVQATWVTTDTDLLDVTLRPTNAKDAATSTSKTRQVAVASHGSQAPPSTADASTSNTSTAESTANKGTSTTTTDAAQDETISTTANHPWLTADRGWAQAGTLTPGERVREADGRTATVVALTVVPGAADMWDLTVSNVHDFAVGNGAYVVHNCGQSGPSYEDRVKEANGDSTVREPNSHRWDGSQPVTDAQGNPIDRGLAGPDAVRDYGTPSETWIEAKSNVQPGGDLFNPNEVDRNFRQLGTYEQLGRPFEYWVDALPSQESIDLIRYAGGRVVEFP